MILELSLESVFAVVDMCFVSHLPDNEIAIATVGLTESVIAIIGHRPEHRRHGSVARRIGEKNPEAAAHAGAQSILLAVAAAVLLSITGAIFAPEILRLMKAEERVGRRCVYPYHAGWQHGNRFAFLINGIFRRAIDAAIAMRSLWLASIINIFLCPHADQWIRTVPGTGIERCGDCYYWKRSRSSVSMLLSFSQ